MGSEHYNPHTEAEDYQMMKGRFSNNNDLEKQQLDQLIENMHHGKYQRVQNMIEEDQQTNQRKPRKDQMMDQYPPTNQISLNLVEGQTNHCCW